jgi:hypothetical protein
LIRDKPRWQELAVEVMRNATVIVAIVSVSQVPYSAWRQLPRIIAAGTNLRATVVVATMLDLIKAQDVQYWQESKTDITRIFWPESSEGSSNSGILLDCSVEIGQSLENLRRMLDGLTTKPPLSDILKDSTKRVSIIIPPRLTSDVSCRLLPTCIPWIYSPPRMITRNLLCSI